MERPKSMKQSLSLLHWFKKLEDNEVSGKVSAADANIVKPILHCERDFGDDETDDLITISKVKKIDSDCDVESVKDSVDEPLSDSSTPLITVPTMASTAKYLHAHRVSESHCSWRIYLPG